jgi:hypothetical protein
VRVVDAGEQGEDVAGWRRLWAAARPASQPHPVDPERLGEYAALCRGPGPAVASQTFPDVAAHLAAGCSACRADLTALIAILDIDER